ncbi:MAG: hypothetical protein ACTSXY_12260 [Promethearchaeota archaeon]
MENKIYKDLNDKLTILLRNQLEKKNTINAVLGTVCLGLSEVCNGLEKIERENIKNIEKKLKLWKSGKKVLRKTTVKKLKEDLRNAKKDYQKYSKQFLKKAVVFANFSKILDEELELNAGG